MYCGCCGFYIVEVPFKFDYVQYLKLSCDVTLAIELFLY